MDYLQEIQEYFKDDNSSEHSYRTSFENFLKEVFPTSDGYFTQQDQKAINGNKPDFIILKNKVPVLYIEVKKVGEDLDKIEKSSQAERYFGYDNLIISDYVNFRFYRNGQRYDKEISLGEVNRKSKSILLSSNNIDILTTTIKDFIKDNKESIKSGIHLAKIMGAKAKRIHDNVLDMLANDTDKYADLYKIRDVIQQNLITGLDDNKFADMYAQTLVYGLFAARYNDDTPETFSRVEARDLVPKTNPFLANFFDHIAGASFPNRLKYIVDELCEVFTHAEITKLLHDFYGKEKDNKDPVIHFYEDFLFEYDSKKKMEMGVFYTPRPVVHFIIRAVDEILKNEFSLSKGLADTSKITKQFSEIDDKGRAKKISKEYHKVQILDVATGTGTFLNETILHIYKSFEGQEGRWKSYVEEELLPRLHGFELMMASYTIAHLKLGMTLHDTGAIGISKRLGVYLTNTLEEARDTNRQTNIFTQLGLQDAISMESLYASEVKKDYPIMCVIGNPPYAVSSSNKEVWIQEKLKDYKNGLNEKKINLDDDYIKFIRFAQYMVDKNSEGVVAYISNNSFVDGITHRKMRESLLKSFDSIYILDLHGNVRKKEVSPDGSKDQNVFDIMQGVSINIFVKTNKKEKNEFGKVFSYDLFGERKHKYDFLNKNNLSNINWQDLKYTDPYYFFQKKDFSLLLEYEKGFKVNEIFIKNNSGVETQKDSVIVNFDKKEAEEVFDLFISESAESLKRKFDITLDKSIKIKKDIISGNVSVEKVFYRPFDIRYCLYSKTTSGVMHRSRYEVMKNYLIGENTGLCFSRIVSSQGMWSDINISDSIIEKGYMAMRVSNAAPTFPLYLYTDQKEKVPNLDKEIWGDINKVVGETTPENILDYVYGYLHYKNYIEKYNEFLKIDFPRVPYPKDKSEFDKYVAFGNKLRLLHLMDAKTLEAIDANIIFPESGSDTLEDKYPKYILDDEDKCAGKVYINEAQYFGNVSKSAWEFYIGGYQPAQKWLKDRKGRKLSSKDIEHYQNIVKVLGETERLMNVIMI